MPGGEVCRSKTLNDVERETMEDPLDDSHADSRHSTGLKKKIGPPSTQCFSPNTHRECGIRPNFSYIDNITVRGRRGGDESERGKGNIVGKPSWCKIDDITGEVYFVLDGSCPITPPRSHAALRYPPGASSSCTSRMKVPLLPLSSPRVPTKNERTVDDKMLSPSGRRTARGRAILAPRLSIPRRQFLSPPPRVTNKMHHHSPTSCVEESNMHLESN